jgi:hypothetical protein
MAITINATPKDFAPVYNKMEYLISSTNVAQPNFAYLVDIYINFAVTKTARLRIPARPSDNKGKVDIHRVLESALTSDVGNPLGTDSVYDATNSFLTYVIKFGEEYGTTIVQYPDLTIDTIRKTFNGSLEKRPFVNWDDTEYELDGATKKFMTNMPNDNKVSLDSHGWLYYRGFPFITDFVIVRFLTGGAVQSVQIDAAATAANIRFVPSAPASLNNIDNANFTAGSQPIITPDTERYYMIALDGGGNVVSEQKHFTLQEACKYNANTLIFQNNLGGFDNFTLNVDTVVGNDIVYSMNEREKVTYYTKKSETIKLMSDWITEAESNWLLELMSSPEIYLQNGDELTAVAKIKATNYTKKKVVRDKLFKIDVELELGYDDYRQRI